MSARRTSLRPWTLGLVALLACALVGCTQDPPSKPVPAPSPSASSSTPVGPVELSFGVFGSADEVAGYDDMVREFNALSDDVHVSVKPWADRSEEIRALKSGALPDVFLLSRRDLADFTEGDLVQPVDELLDSRGVDFGDSYARDALKAFSLDNRLECMPYGISPMVIYLNTDLVSFEKMQNRDLGGPAYSLERPFPRSWTFDQFAATAEFGTRPRRGSRGVYIEPTLRGLAPFIVSGGGHLFNDDGDAEAPATSLALSDDSSQGALNTTLPLLRNSSVTLTERQLQKHTPLEWFKRGKLAMMAGFRDLVPDLREQRGLDFDVMPMPRLDSDATIGDITGLCLSSETKNVEAAADFLTHAVSQESVTKVARAGYLVPANLTVAASDDFMQPGRQPSNSRVFYYSVRNIFIPPVLDSWRALEDAVAPDLSELVTTPILDPDTIAEITARIDELSQPILMPPTETPEPTESGSAEPSD